MAPMRTILATLLCVALAASLPNALAERSLRGTNTPPCCVFQDCGGSASSLYNRQLTIFGGLLTNFLGYGGRRLQTGWCGSGGLGSATILAPNNDAMRAGFKKLKSLYNNYPYPSYYVNSNPEVVPFNSPLYRAIDAITSAQIIQHAIDFYKDPRFTKQCATPATCGVLLNAYGYGDAFTYTTKVLVYRATNNLIYAELQGELLPGASRIRIYDNPTKVFNYGTSYVYEVTTLAAPKVVPAAVNFVPGAPGGLDKSTSLAAILTTVGVHKVIPYPCGPEVSPTYPARLCVHPYYSSNYVQKYGSFAQCGGAGGECSANSYSKPCVNRAWPGAKCTYPNQTCKYGNQFYWQCK